MGLGVLHFKKSFGNFSKMDIDKDVSWVKKEIKKSKQVNINTAGIEELTKLPGIGKVIAGRIIDYRNTHNLFTDKEDIKKVKGIGPKKFEKMEEFILLE